MKTRILLQTIAASVAVMVAGVASAVPVYPDFTVNPIGISPSTPLPGVTTPFTANDIGGSYSELLTLNPTSATSGTFQASLSFLAQYFDEVDSITGKNTFSANQTGLGVNYGLLAIFNGTGTYSTTGSGTTFTLTPGGNLTLDYDTGAHAGFNQGATTFTFKSNGDTLTTIATGVGVNGSGTPANAGNLSGAFGQTTTFALNAIGGQFFTSPSPFYPLSFQSGQLEAIQIPTAASTILVTGSINANFLPIPEPADLALVGIALLGLGLAVKRRHSA
ncbi:flocculation-associated PEP-CTERM protein PepA [Scleromatobacter humisilvae]|uniref:Flocculation-associated PEP-CTERM protein PepA n=1 Tax=Scleromatobacter humisilvae TaxID=2897159 RepID=A0A9X1YL44_9BURK|nr:flocculation-associated PEP-CTERM protein PepA [Scleromatobacter humisilvae]MCK9686377.1 flocculation-associated PEP-CTERM protein PepA [Scleromatobacter humisilvae]